MSYSVTAQSQAVMDAENIRAELALRDRDYSDRWIDSLDQAFISLKEFPRRFVLAPESRRSTFEVRHLLVDSYRVLYAVHGDAVRVLRIVHVARRPLKPSELN